MDDVEKNKESGTGRIISGRRKSKRKGENRHGQERRTGR